jgi:hypothetical protein
MLTIAVIVVPLVIAILVTMWSLEQVRYRPKRRRPAATVGEADELRGAEREENEPAR